MIDLSVIPRGIRLVEVGPDDHVDEARLVLEGQEDESFCRSGALPADHEPGVVDAAAVRQALGI